MTRTTSDTEDHIPLVHQPEGSVSRRSLLMGTAGLAVASTTFAAAPALAKHEHPTAHSKGVTPSGSLSNRIYAVVDGVADIARQPTDIPPAITRRTPETVRVELETIELEARLDGRTTFRFWTFNGTVPGPFVRVRVGDKVEVTLKNMRGAGPLCPGRPCAVPGQTRACRLPHRRRRRKCRHLPGTPKGTVGHGFIWRGITPHVRQLDQDALFREACLVDAASGGNE